MLQRIAVAGIHTGIGKTIASAIITEAIDGEYWKPVQAGIEERDSETVKKLIKNGDKRVHEEAVILKEPLSPHAAAKLENKVIDIAKIAIPKNIAPLIIETAGGVFSPMSFDRTMLDFILMHNLPVILIAKNYLGSINHTLLSWQVLKNAQIKVIGIIINGETNEESESFINSFTQNNIIARIPQLEALNPFLVGKCANEIKDSLIHSIQTCEI